MSKPEYQGPPEQHYDEREARKYTTNSRIRKVQYELSQRAYELLELPETNKQLLLLDIGCGSGLSGQVLAEQGHSWIGMDISRPMIDVAREEQQECEEGGPASDLIQLDLGQGLPFRPGSFDGAISISAIQWLCHSNSRDEVPRQRLLRLFQSLFACLSRSARAVFQFYPESEQQCQLITQQALRAGFQGGLIIDRPDSPKQRKVFLVLSAGKAAAIVHQLPALKRKKKHKSRPDYGGEEEDGREEQEEEEEVAGQKQRIQIVGRNRPSTNERGSKLRKVARKVISGKKLKRVERKKHRRLEKKRKNDGYDQEEQMDV